MLNTTHEEKSSEFLHEYLQKTDLSSRTMLNQYAREHQITREENESDEAFTKRVKKQNYLNLAQQLIRQSTRPTAKSDSKSPVKVLPKPTSQPLAPLKRMKPVFSPAEDPDFDDEFDDPSRDIYDDSSSSSSHEHDDYDDDEDQIRPRTNHLMTRTTHPSTHKFANDIKQKLSSLAADVVRTFGTSSTLNDDDLTKPLPTSQSFSSRLFSQRNKEIPPTMK